MIRGIISGIYFRKFQRLSPVLTCLILLPENRLMIQFNCMVFYMRTTQFHWKLLLQEYKSGYLLWKNKVGLLDRELFSGILQSSFRGTLNYICDTNTDTYHVYTLHNLK